MADGVFGDSPDGWGVRGGREGGRESVQELELDCFSLKPAGLRMSRVRVVCFCHSKTAFGRHTEKKVDVAFALGSFLLILRL